MTKINYADLPKVSATINYIDESVKNPEFFLFDPEPCGRPPPPKADKRQMPIHDVRKCMGLISLDDNGFSFSLQNLPNLNYEDPGIVKTKYYPLCADLIKTETGCKEVYVFDHNVRETGERKSGIFPPARNAHNDYTNESAPARVKELMAGRAQELLARRYAFINIWRPLRGPVDTQPLAVCDAKTVEFKDFISAHLRYPDRSGKVFSVKHNQRHRWCYLAAMEEEEIMLIKCFDTAGPGIAKYTAHTSFYEPEQPTSPKGRKSIEVRTLAFF
jgi:hypothetical protein